MSSNPAFNSSAYQQAAVAANAAQQQQGGYISADQLQGMYDRPGTAIERMSYEDTVVKTGISFLFVLAGAALGAVFSFLWIPGAVAGLVLAFVNIFSKKPSAFLVLAYALAQGMALGGLSAYLEMIYPGIALQALLATGAVFATTLILFSNGIVRASRKFTKFVMVAAGAYFLFSLVNFGLMLFGANTDPWGLRSMEVLGIPLGLWLAPVIILIGAYFYIMDFEEIKQGVQLGAPKVYGWRAAFGLTMTTIWLYVEMLRIIAILRGNE